MAAATQKRKKQLWWKKLKVKERQHRDEGMR
jgi:hypothetical protein